MVCRMELNVWIAAEFDWKPQNPKVLDQIINTPSSNSTGKTSLLSEFDIELTLSKRRIPGMGDPDPDKPGYRRLNEAQLTKDAFLPKKYTIRLEKGVFVPSVDAKIYKFKNPSKFALRLAFDKAPYPSREEWKEPGGAAQDALLFWEWNEFCREELPSSGGWTFSGIMSKLWRG